MKEMFEWVAWYQDLSQRVAEIGPTGLESKSKEIDWQGGWSFHEFKSRFGSDLLDPFSFISLVTANAIETKPNGIAFKSISEAFGLKSEISELGFKHLHIPALNNQSPYFFAKDRLTESNPDALWRLFREAVKGLDSVSSDNFEQALLIPDVGVRKLTQSLYLINAADFLPADDQIAKYRFSSFSEVPQNSSDFKWDAYQKLVDEARDAFEGCELYEFGILACLQSRESDLAAHLGNRFQIDTKTGDGAKDRWGNFLENSWFYASEASSHLQKATKGSVIIARAGQNQGHGIGIVYQNDYRNNGWSEEGRVDLIWLNKSDVNFSKSLELEQEFSPVERGDLDNFSESESFCKTLKRLDSIAPETSHLRKLSAIRMTLEAMTRSGEVGDSNPTKGFDPLRCISIDLEVDKHGRVHKLGAIRADTGKSITCSGSDLKDGRRRLADLSEGADFVLGHNVIDFDLGHLRAIEPSSPLLDLPPIDTLRLSPLSFPKNPYHKLVKHYQDGRLRRGRLNDPELDARIALDLFNDERDALSKVPPSLLAAWHWLITPHYADADAALDRLFSLIRQKPRPVLEEAQRAIEEQLKDRACSTHSAEAIELAFSDEEYRWPLAYALAWISVSGGNSVMPPWVRHQFPKSVELVRRLRDAACSNPECEWCSENRNAKAQLKRRFGFDKFRPKPVQDGKPMQQAIVESSLARHHTFGILPTGTGKSLCYQIPALSSYYRTGELTVVISPLVALMSDQVRGLKGKGIDCCYTINGLLSMPERSDVLDKVTLGDAGILLISPEQLRTRSLRQALSQREIGMWVIDEAHCLSRWGHDFRPDYHYVVRFIRQTSIDKPKPLVMCLTATAKTDVINEIMRHFKQELNVELRLFNGGTDRNNLVFDVVRTSGSTKFDAIYKLLGQYLFNRASGGAVVYCATRKQSEDVSAYLNAKGVEASVFHAGLQPETKKDVQKRFTEGELRVIVATNAFGMGIDKPDVRLVVHAEIPGSLENYLQEAGRAGRDNDQACCVLLYQPEDVERQFGLSAYTRLNQREINGILWALKRLNRKDRFKGEVVATTGEILTEDADHAFQRDSATDDTRVRTAIAWLEKARLVTREENVVRIFPSSLLVNSVEDVERRLERTNIAEAYRKKLLAIARMIIEANADEGMSTDDLIRASGMRYENVSKVLLDLQALGVLNDDTVITAFVHKGVVRTSKKRFDDVARIEKALLDYMRESAPDEDQPIINVRMASHKLQGEGMQDALPEKIWRILSGISYDGKGIEDGRGGSITLRKLDMESARVALNREWRQVQELVEKDRRQPNICSNIC